MADEFIRYNLSQGAMVPAVYGAWVSVECVQTLKVQLGQAREAIRNLEDMQEAEETWRDQLQAENERLRARVKELGGVE